ncbi:hypothetical protein HanHA89_Chr09g0320301 [Helianthus annuus]|nr:hypothetical protein HanHA89_Chr09g0320301 [Helianthus annuus]
MKCLEQLYLSNCTGINRLPQSIHQLKGLRIFGSREQLQSYGFKSLTEIFGSYYVVL